MMKFKALAVTLVAIVAVFAFASVSKAEVLTFGTTTLKVGSSGMYVTNLQTVLNTYSAAGLTADGAFGSKTNTAVMNFQMAQGLTADGLVGTKTKEKLEAVQGGMVTGGTATCPAGYTCTATGTGSTGSFVINGDAGSIESVDELGSLSGEEVGQGDENVEVVGANIGASEDSDIQLTAVKVSFENYNAPTTDEDFDEYAESISVMFGDDEVASVDVDDMNEDDGVWSKTITLESSAIIDADSDEDLTITVTAVDNLDSGEIGTDDWVASIEEIRYRDQTGQVFTDATTGDLGILDSHFDFASFAEANDVEMSLSVSDDSPESGVIEVDETSNTDGKVLVIGEIEADGSDLVFDSIPVYFESSEADLDGVINSVTLEIDGEEYTETVTTAAASSSTITFDNLDLTVDEGDTVEFTVTADFNEIDATLFAEGTTVSAQIGVTQRGNIDVEDQDGEELESGDKTGTVVGEVMTAYSSGIMVTLVSASETVTTGTGANDDIATFIVKFDVEAFAEDVYIPDVASNAGTVAVDFTIDKAGTELSVAQYGSAVSAVVTSTESDLSGNGNFEVRVDETGETITLTISVANSGSLGAGLYRATLSNIRWNTTDSAGTYNSYTFNLDDFKTDYISIN
ncbi:MAG: peptidoglycan-binding protein [Candidatus Pacebacteria bacterium]|nr:peptidoglycan-binding protein [Candidatus Paceibacterota bacterium]MBP9058027.1 peptidoglycan-binding protein [Candidatus Paceibacterota bacterium]